MLDQTWRTSSRSGDNGQCVEVRRIGNTIEVRDSKDRSGPSLQFTLTEWVAFTSGAKGSEFDV